MLQNDACIDHKATKHEFQLHRNFHTRFQVGQGLQEPDNMKSITLRIFAYKLWKNNDKLFH